MDHDLYRTFLYVYRCWVRFDFWAQPNYQERNKSLIGQNHILKPQAQCELKDAEKRVAERLFGQRMPSMMFDYNISMLKAFLKRKVLPNPRQSKRDGSLEQDSFLFVAK